MSFPYHQLKWLAENSPNRKTMIAKEKAEELVEKFYSISGYRRFAIGYALICVDEIMCFCDTRMKHNGMMALDFWKEVKKEIERL